MFARRVCRGGKSDWMSGWDLLVILCRKNSVAVTGANGFIASQIVDLLVARPRMVSKVIATDVLSEKEFWTSRTKRGIKADGGVTLEYRKADITDQEQVLEALKGSQVVCHAAAVIDVSPSEAGRQSLYKVNVEGTRHVISACKLLEIPNLIYTSTIEVSCLRPNTWRSPKSGPYDFGGNDYYLIGDYSASKAIAEKQVVQANGTWLASSNREGKSLSLCTCSLRPIMQYGDYDTAYAFATALNLARNDPNKLVRITGDLKPMQFCYVGNTAWAHVCTIYAMLSDSTAMAGKSYYVTDDTPVHLYFDTLQTFLEHFGFTYRRAIPYPLLYYPLYFYYSLSRTLPFMPRLHLGLTPFIIQLICDGFQASYEPLTKDVGYQPLYNAKESMERTVDYFKSQNVVIKNIRTL